MEENNGVIKLMEQTHADLKVLKDRMENGGETPSREHVDRVVVASLFTFFTVYLVDHPRIETMWKTYKPVVWLIGIMGGAIVVELAVLVVHSVLGG